MLGGQSREEPKPRAKATIIGFDGTTACDRCQCTHSYSRGCPVGGLACRQYLMGACLSPAKTGCGRPHPPIDLDPDQFPDNLAWQDVVVLPPGALEGRCAAQWWQLLERHAAMAAAPPPPPQPRLQPQLLQPPAAAAEGGKRRRAVTGKTVAEVAAACRAVLASGDARTPSKGSSTIIWYDGTWECSKCGECHEVDEFCQKANSNPLCRGFLMGACPKQVKGGCGYQHLTTLLDPDEFPDDMPWQEVVVLPLHALEGQRGREWRQLLERHAARRPGEQQQPVVEKWDGRWVCACGRATQQDKCRECGEVGPCREWVQGRCRRLDCKFPHTMRLPGATSPRAPPPLQLQPPPPRLPEGPAGGAAERDEFPALPGTTPAAAAPAAVASPQGATGAAWRAAAVPVPPPQPTGLAAAAGGGAGRSLWGPEEASSTAAAAAAAAGAAGSPLGAATPLEEFPALPGAAVPAAATFALGRSPPSPGKGLWAGVALAGTAAAAPEPSELASSSLWGSGQVHSPTALGAASAGSLQQESWPDLHGGLSPAVPLPPPLPARQPHWGPAAAASSSTAGGGSGAGGWLLDEPPLPLGQLGPFVPTQQHLPGPPTPLLGGPELLWPGQSGPGLAIAEPLLPHLGGHLPPGPGPTAAAAPWSQQQQQQQPGSGQWAPPGTQPAEPEEDADHLELLKMMGLGGAEPTPSVPSSSAGAAAAAAPGLWSTLLQHPEQQLQQQQQPLALALAHEAGAGLANEAGEYNCFLNAIIQCLWRCAEFRRQVVSWPPYLYASDPVVHALHGLFAALEGQEAERGRGGAAGSAGAAGAAERSVVNPNPLREALSAAGLFRVGEMSDAGEVLLAMFDRIEALGPAAQAALEAVFGLRVREYVFCEACDLYTHESHYTQYTYNAQATGLRKERGLLGPGARMGQLLRAMEDAVRKTCDTDKGGCNVPQKVVHALSPPPPRVFTLQLAWESQQEEPADIAAALAAVDERLDLSSVYKGLLPGQAVYQLRSLVCYYGAHYFAFVLLPEQQAWYIFDDTRISRVGGWADVRQKCQAGRTQPSLLLWHAVT